MSKLVGRVPARQAIPRSLIDDRTIDPHVYASSAGVEFVAEPVALEPANARELAMHLRTAADQCDAPSDVSIFEALDATALRVVEAMLPAIEAIPMITPDEVARARSRLVGHTKKFVGTFLATEAEKIITDLRGKR